MGLAAENCGCAYQPVSVSIANSPVCNGFLLFMALIESFINRRCNIAEPCSQIMGADHVEEVYDFVVVGGGTAGSIVAARLAEDGRHSVLLVEAGGPEPPASRVPSFWRNYWNTELDWAYRTKPANYCLEENGNGCRWYRGKVLGGTNVINGMMCVRGHPADFEDWANMGVEGWSWNEVYPYFLKFEGNREIGSVVSSEYHSDKGVMPVQHFRYTPEIVSDLKIGVKQAGYEVISDNNDPTTPFGFSVAQAFNADGQRYTTARAYLQPLADKPNLTVLLDALVTKVLIEGTAAYGIEYSKHNKKKRVTAAKEVIVSAGAINTPQILMLSGIGPREMLQKFNIPVVADLPVGKNFRNHVGAPLYFTFDKVKNVQSLDWDALMRYMAYGDGPMSSTGAIQFTGLLYSSLANSSRKQPDLQFSFSGYFAECSATGAVGEPVDWSANGMNFSIDPMNLLPRSVGELTLQSTDPRHPPLLDPNFLEHPDDLVILKDGIRIVKKIVESEHLQNKYGIKLDKRYSACDTWTAWCDEWMECIIRQYTDPQNHQAGTAAISLVVDSTLKVYNVTGLRVIDASAMPIQVTGNPQASVMMVAERGADFIKSDWPN